MKCILPNIKNLWYFTRKHQKCSRVTYNIWRFSGTSHCTTHKIFVKFLFPVEHFYGSLTPKIRHRYFVSTNTARLWWNPSWQHFTPIGEIRYQIFLPLTENVRNRTWTHCHIYPQMSSASFKPRLYPCDVIYQQRGMPMIHRYADWIGLDLFNDDTRPSGHISRPAQVNVSQSCFHSLNNYSSLIILYTSGG